MGDHSAQFGIHHQAESSHIFLIGRFQRLKTSRPLLRCGKVLGFLHAEFPLSAFLVNMHHVRQPEDHNGHAVVLVVHAVLMKLMSPLRSSRAVRICDRSSVSASRRISSSRSCLEMCSHSMFFGCNLPSCTTITGLPLTRIPKPCE